MDKDHQLLDIWIKIFFSADTDGDRISNNSDNKPLVLQNIITPNKHHRYNEHEII